MELRLIDIQDRARKIIDALEQDALTALGERGSSGSVTGTDSVAGEEPQGSETLASRVASHTTE